MGLDLAKKYGADLTVAHATQIPYVFPLDMAVGSSDRLLKQAEAMGTEKGVHVTTRTFQSRSMLHVVQTLVTKEQFDLVISDFFRSADELSHLNCRVWICKP